MKRFIIMGVLALTVGGCSHPTAPVGFTVEPDRTKVFFYAAYSNPDDRPTFDNTFSFHVDGAYVEDIDADQYIEQHLPAGNHVFEVEEIAWWGSVLGHKKVMVRIDLTKPSYIAEEIMPDGKTALSAVDAAHGEAAVATRTRKCLCQFLISRIF